MAQNLSITLPKRRPGESWKSFAARVAQWARGDDVRSKTDLKDWTGSLPFHLNKED